MLPSKHISTCTYLGVRGHWETREYGMSSWIPRVAFLLALSPIQCGPLSSDAYWSPESKITLILRDGFRS